MANHTQPAPKRRTGRKILLGTLGVFVLLVVMIGATNSGGDKGTTTAATPTTTPVAAPVAVPTYVAPAPAPAPVAVEEAPKGTTAQRNAVDKAESYLSYSAFSRSGLIKQLAFEGFSNADATYAVDNITVDWTEQADKKAASYMSYSSFSRSGLIKQLEFEGFSSAQAAHGATSVGL